MKKLQDLNIKNKEENVKDNEAHGIIVKSANKTIPDLIQEALNHIFSPRELKVHCITDDE